MRKKHTRNFRWTFPMSLGAAARLNHSRFQRRFEFYLQFAPRERIITGCALMALGSLMLVHGIQEGMFHWSAGVPLTAVIAGLLGYLAFSFWNQRKSKVAN